VSDPDEDKPVRYAEIGIREMWRVNSNPDGDFMVVEILDLQDGDGPENRPDSLVFPGLLVEHLGEAFWRAWSNDHERLADYLTSKLTPTGNPGANGSKTLPSRPGSV